MGCAEMLKRAESAIAIAGAVSKSPVADSIESHAIFRSPALENVSIRLEHPMSVPPFVLSVAPHLCETRLRGYDS
ncbi:MAG: hypothetical protein ACRD3Q_21760 [Terriglobales bacterium]